MKRDSNRKKDSVIKRIWIYFFIFYEKERE